MAEPERRGNHVAPIRFQVNGKPVTQGSKQPFIPTYKDGTPVRRHGPDCIYYQHAGKPEYNCGCPIMVNTTETNAQELDAWRQQIAWVAKAKMRSREPLDGLVVASFTFRLRRPKGHYGTGRNERVLRRDAPAAPGVVPDVGKLARAVEDAMTGIVYTDDSRIVTRLDEKRYVHPWEEPGVDVTVALAARQTVGDLIDNGEALRPEEEFGQLGLDGIAL